MISASELRIGNWVNCHFQTTNFNAKVEFISLSEKFKRLFIYVNDNGATRGFSEDNVDPIPLTSDILIQCGFHKWGRDDIPSTISFEKEMLHIAPYGKIYGWKFVKTEENNPNSWKPKVEIQYVHHLQNLYHSLAGEELNMQL